MSAKFVIQWKSKVNGRAGRGTKLFEREGAERLIEELNEEYPSIEHSLAVPQPERPEPEPPESEPGDQPRFRPEREQIVTE